MAAAKGAGDRLIDAEDLTEREIRTPHAHFGELVELAKRTGAHR